MPNQSEEQVPEALEDISAVAEEPLSSGIVPENTFVVVGPAVITPEDLPPMETSKESEADLMVLTSNVFIAPKVHVGVIIDSATPSNNSSKELDSFKAYLSKYKISYKIFSDSLGNPAIAHLLRSCCIALVVSENKDIERKVLASGRFCLRLSDTQSPCPYVKNVNYKNLTHIIINAQSQLCKRGIPQSIARYAIANQPL